LAGQIAEYNEEGDDVEMTFPSSLTAHNAVPKFARMQAEGKFPDGCEDCDQVQPTSKGKGPKPKGVDATSGGKGKGKK
jgi:hypothetical protein